MKKTLLIFCLALLGFSTRAQAILPIQEIIESTKNKETVPMEFAPGEFVYACSGNVLTVESVQKLADGRYKQTVSRLIQEGRTNTREQIKYAWQLYTNFVNEVERNNRIIKTEFLYRNFTDQEILKTNTVYQIAWRRSNNLDHGIELGQGEMIIRKTSLWVPSRGKLEGYMSELFLLGTNKSLVRYFYSSSLKARVYYLIMDFDGAITECFMR